jgi:uncharacterized protein (TIGR00251 family)
VSRGWYRREAGGIVLSVRLTPKADRDEIQGVGVLADGCEVLRVRVRALPEGGAADTALVRLIAKRLKLPQSTVEIVSGATQRLKQVRIAGNPGTLAERVEVMVAE